MPWVEAVKQRRKVVATQQDLPAVAVANLVDEAGRGAKHINNIACAAALQLLRLMAQISCHHARGLLGALVAGRRIDKPRKLAVWRVPMLGAKSYLTLIEAGVIVACRRLYRIVVGVKGLHNHPAVRAFGAPARPSRHLHKKLQAP